MHRVDQLVERADGGVEVELVDVRRDALDRLVDRAAEGAPGRREVATAGPGRVNAARFAWKNRHTRFRKRKAPSTPWSLHSRSFSGGAMKSSNTRPVSAP